jgi:GPH family glycoside/pentoside/hexuronide:cation symporter
MLGLCLGDFARAVLGGLIVTYTLKFFNVTPSSGLPLLLPAGMMGLLRSVGVVFDAITDPWVANWSDRCNSPKGRRIPFMRWAALPYTITCLLIFFPPSSGVSVVNIIWVGAMLLCYYLCSTLYCVPFMALQQEITSDPRRRVFFYTLNSLMYVLGSAVIYALPVMVSAFQGGGMTAIASWRLALSIFAGIGAVCALVPSFIIREKDYVQAKSCYTPLMEGFKATLRYRNFVIMTVGYLIMQAGFAFFNSALLFYIDTLLGLKESFATIVLAISIVVGICTYPLVNLLARHIGKKPLLLFACFTYVFIYMGIYFYKPISDAIGTQPLNGGFLSSLAGPTATVGCVTAAILIGVLIAFPIACTNILPPSAFADMAQYDRILTGLNRTGTFVAARQFVTKLSQAIVAAIVSYTMYLGSTDSYPTHAGVRATALIAACCICLAIVAYVFYDDRSIIATIEEWNRKEKQAQPA